MTFSQYKSGMLYCFITVLYEKIMTINSDYSGYNSISSKNGINVHF